MFFCKKKDNRAIAFVDYEYWYVSIKNRFSTKPDIKEWCASIRENYQMEGILFFANFLQGGLPEEISRIREVSCDIIETQCGNNGHFMKDMSDVVILDFLYRWAAKKKSPPTFILFTGDGHFQPAVRYLTQDLGKRVEVYGVQATMSRALRDAATESFEIPQMDEKLTECFRYIVADFDRIAMNHNNPFATYQSLVTRVSNSQGVPKERVELALNEMMNRGWLTRKKYRVAYNKPMLNVIMPEWDELIDAGLHKPE